MLLLLTCSAAVTAGGTSTSTTAGGKSKSTTRGQRPSFLFILADDWGWGDVGVYGANGDITLSGTNVRTPTLDALARNGTLLTDFHGNSLCSPSRVQWMTGRFAGDVSFNGNPDVTINGWKKNPSHGAPYQLPVPSGGGASPFAGGLLNVGHMMKSAGYKTAHYGKWHIGGCSPPGNHTPPPSEYGFDHTATHASPLEARCVESTATDVSLAPGSDLIPDMDWWSADVDGVATDLAVAFIQNATQEKQPFYLHLWLHMSHNTINPRPEQYRAAYPFETTCLWPRAAAAAAANPNGTGANPGEPCDFQTYWGAQHDTDASQIKRVLDAVDSVGVRDSTYVIFSTDNGPAATGQMTTAFGGANNGGGMNMGAVGRTGPFRGHKVSLYEGGHRVPFIITGPNVRRGAIEHSLASNVDWLPTVASLARVAINNRDRAALRGIDLSPVLLDAPLLAPPQLGPRAIPLYWRGGGGGPPCWNRSPSMAMREGDWKLLFAPLMTTAPIRTQSAFRVELYNVSAAALVAGAGAFAESQNIAETYPAVAERMMAKMMAWHETTPCPFGNSNNSRLGPCQWVEIAWSGCESFQFPGSPTRSCNGKPCPTPGHPGPCVCPSSEEKDEAFTAYLDLLNM